MRVPGGGSGRPWISTPGTGTSAKRCSFSIEVLDRASSALRWNPRRLYPRVDDKLLTKRLCAAAGIPIPKLLAVAAHHFELRALPALSRTIDVRAVGTDRRRDRSDL